jgi:hypothetical protein
MQYKFTYSPPKNYFIFDALVLSKCNDYYYSRSNVSLMPLLFNNMSYNSISLINTM